MVRIRITSRERELLETSFSKKACKFNLVIENFIIIIEEDIKNILETIVDNLSDYFISDGLQNNDEPNELGLELECLNSKFIKELQKVNDEINLKNKKSFFKRKAK